MRKLDRKGMNKGDPQLYISGFSKGQTCPANKQVPTSREYGETKTTSAWDSYLDWGQHHW